MQVEHERKMIVFLEPKRAVQVRSRQVCVSAHSHRILLKAENWEQQRKDLRIMRTTAQLREGDCEPRDTKQRLSNTR